MTWTIHKYTAFPSFADDWDNLSERYYRSHPFLDVRFVQNALDYFPNDNLVLAVESENNRVRCLALLDHQQMTSWQTFCPSQLPFTMLLCSNENLLPELLRGLFRKLPGYATLLGLKHYDEQYRRSLADKQRIETLQYAMTMSVDSTGEFDRYWQARSKNLRRNIRRYFNRLERNGLSYSLSIIARMDEFNEAVAAYGKIESAGWKGKAGSAISSGNTQEKFYAALLRDFSLTDGARIFHLTLEGKIVSSRLAVVNGGILVILKTTYDETFSRYAPGRLLLQLVLRYAFEQQGIDRVEFYTKATQNQLQWATSSRMIYHHNYYSSDITRHLVPALRYIKKSGAMWRK